MKKTHTDNAVNIEMNHCTREWRKAMGTFYLTTLICIGGFNTAFAANVGVGNAGGAGEKGKACKVTSGPNRGETGTYSGDGWCEGSWGGTECSSRGKSKCKDVESTLSRYWRDYFTHSRPSAPEVGPLVQVPLKRADLVISNIEVGDEPVKQINGYSLIPVSIHINNAGSASTESWFKLSGHYYTNGIDDVILPKVYIEPGMVSQYIDVGETVILKADIAIPDYHISTQPYITIDLDTCDDSPQITQSRCRVIEEIEDNNSYSFNFLQ